jgi:hypothetical protein
LNLVSRVRNSHRFADGSCGRLALLALLALAGAAGCEININNPAGFDFTGRSPSLVVTDTLSVTGADTSWAIDLPLHTSDRLFVGRHGGFQGVVLLRFSDLPADAVVQDARLTFYRRAAHADEEEPAALDLAIAPLTVDWDTTWTGARLGEVTTGAEAASVAVLYTTTADTFGLTLPNTLVQTWVDDPTGAAARRGLALTAPTDATWLLQLDAGDDHYLYSQRRPRLRLRWVPAEGGSSRISVVYPELDLSLLTLTGTPDPGEFWITRGAAWRCLITFDLSGLPAGATINRAVLRLGVSTTDGVALPFGFTAALPLGAAPWTLLPSQMFDSATVSSAVSVAEGDSTVSLLVTRALGAYLTSDRSALGLVVLAYAEGSGIGRVTVLDATAPADRRARLDLIYSVPPGGAP